jgi:hypothetical protein
MKQREGTHTALLVPSKGARQAAGYAFQKALQRDGIDCQHLELNRHVHHIA